MLIPFSPRRAGRRLMGAAFLAVPSTLAFCAAYADPVAAPGDKEDSIVVTASPLSNDPDAYATSVDKVNKDQILQHGGANLADALRDVPGVTGTGFAAGASRPVIRGFDASRVRLLENGVGSFDVSDIGPDHGVPIDPLAAQSIEVVRGAATLRYGSQAIGGVVNAINNRVPLNRVEKPLSGDLTGSYGINGDLGEGSGQIDAGTDNIAIHADGFRRDVGSYAIPGGTQPNSFFHGDGYSLGGSAFMGEKSRVGAAFVHSDARYGIPSDVTFIDMKQNKALFGSSVAIDKGPLETLNVDMGYANYTHSEKDPDLGTLSTFNDHEWDVRAESLFGAFGPFSQAAAGLQAQNRHFAAGGEGGDYLFPTTSKSLAGFGFAESKLADRLNLQLGVRIESVKIAGTPASNTPTALSFTPISGSLGLVFAASDALKLGLTLTSAARAPGQTELFARGPHDGPGTFETGDPNLKLERANSVEGTLRFKTATFRFEGSAWAAKFTNFIYGRLTGRTCDDEGTCVDDSSLALKELLYEQRDATFWGLEGKSTIGLATTKSGVLGLDLTADYVRATLQGGTNVPRIPPYHVGGGPTWQSEALDVGVRVTYAGEQDKPGPTETPTKGFVTLDSHIAVRPFKANRGLELLIVGSNLTNEVRRNATSINKDDVVLPGRDVRFIVRAAF